MVAKMAKCKIESCREEALTLAQTCWEHMEKKDDYVKRVNSEIGKGASLRGANLSKVCLRDMDLSKSDLSGVNLTRSDLSGVNLFDANLANSELLGINLSGADLTSSNLENGDLTRATLFGARLWHANLKGANLIEANLSSADLWNAKLFNVRLWRTDLRDVVSLSKQNFADKRNRYLTIYRINEKGISSAESAYRGLKRNFLSSGRYNDASWASFKEKRMERLLLKKKGNPAYIPSLIMDILCGYGEKPHRIILSSFLVISLYALLYFLFKALSHSDLSSYKPTIVDYIYFSIVTFTTVGYGDFVPKALSHFRLLAASEAFVGAFMIGLFIFTLARKYSAR